MKKTIGEKSHADVPLRTNEYVFLPVCVAS